MKYKYIPIVSREGESSIRVAHCFESLDNGLYYVQSLDYIHLNGDTSKQIVDIITRGIELFSEVPLDERTSGFEDINDALLDLENG